MKIHGKEIKDECSHCGNVLACKLFLAGHGIRQERDRITEMIRCQLRNQENKAQQEKKKKDGDQ